LAEAYVLAEQFEEAIALVRPYYEADAENFDLQACILNALAGMGKAWDDFPWKSPPPVIRMSDGVLDECYRFLRRKRKPRSVLHLYERFIPQGHRLFSEDDLLQELLADERFAVTGKGTFAEACARRKG
jgi:D-alanine-D-alanine ligase-like ATP-grasp enzyme